MLTELGTAQSMLPYGLSLLGVWSVYLIARWRTDRLHRAIHNAAIEAGMTEPASLHPLIDPSRCLGCGACTRVCPEGDVIGLVDGKAMLVEPTQCIGHGACKEACPHDAISLVFGTETRGVDIPNVGQDFQTNVPGLYIAGELGGMGLIRNAIEQGRQALERISERSDLGGASMLDVLIVGGGPAGFAASLAAIERGLRFVTVEQESFGGTVAHFPRGKLVMTHPAQLPIVGTMPFREISKEKLLKFWRGAALRAGLTINYGERVERVVRQNGGFAVQTTRQHYLTHTVLLAIGRRGTPRRLDVPGEDLAKVVYRLIDPEQFRDKRVLVVGGGDSALEAAASVAGVPGTTVTIAYRGDVFGRAKRKNRDGVETAQAAGRLRVLLKTKVNLISPDFVSLDCDGERLDLANDAIIVCAGGILPTAFLDSIGVQSERKHGTR